MPPSYLLLASRPWLFDVAAQLQEATGFTFHIIKNPQELAEFDLHTFQPRFIFALHWSWIIPKSIWNTYETVIFHMTDLPFGRGGSPLQNLIIRGMKETQLSAIQCAEGLDTGPIYTKKTLSLHGTAQDIFLRSVPIMKKMIVEIIQEQLVPAPQQGEVTLFTRRMPSESSIASLSNVEKIYDYIRMLDAEGYPHAFLEHNELHLTFTDACLQGETLTAQVTISSKDNNNA